MSFGGCLRLGTRKPGGGGGDLAGTRAAAPCHTTRGGRGFDGIGDKLNLQALMNSQMSKQNVKVQSADTTIQRLQCFSNFSSLRFYCSASAYKCPSPRTPPPHSVVTCPQICPAYVGSARRCLMLCIVQRFPFTLVRVRDEL